MNAAFFGRVLGRGCVRGEEKFNVVWAPIQSYITSMGAIVRVGQWIKYIMTRPN